MDLTPLISLLGIFLAALLALLQLRHEREQKTKDREIATKRDLLIDGVRGMLQANSAYMSLINVPTDRNLATLRYQEAMQRITVAACVASLPTVKVAKKFTDMLGPKFAAALLESVELEFLAEHSTPLFERKRVKFAKKLMDDLPQLAASMYEAIGAVRTDIDLAKEGNEEFIAAVTPHLDSVKKVTDELLRKAGDHVQKLRERPESHRVQVELPPYAKSSSPVPPAPR